MYINGKNESEVVSSGVDKVRPHTDNRFGLSSRGSQMLLTILSFTRFYFLLHNTEKYF
jgi:hypothetical protein